MTPGDIEALHALARRLTHAEAIAECIGEATPTSLGTAIRGVAAMLDEAGDALDRIIMAAERVKA